MATALASTQSDQAKTSKVRLAAARLWNSAQAHPVMATLVVALLARAAVAVGLAMLFGGSVFLDDATYSDMAAAMADGRADIWDPYTRWLYEQTATFLVPLTAIYEVFGPHAVAGQLFVACAGAVAAALTTKLCLTFLGRAWALFGGATVALLPSQVFWSSLLFKDALVWALLVGLGVLTATALGATRRRLLITAIGVLVCLFLIAHLRMHTLVVASWGVGLSACFGVAAWRWQRLIGAAAIAVFVPWIVGLGPAGIGLLQGADTLDELRAANAVGAGSAYVDAAPLPNRPTDDRGADQAEGRHTTSGRREGDGSTNPFGDLASETEEAVEANISHLPKGLAALLLRPFPWEETTKLGLLLARLETLVWYPIVLLAFVGLFSTRRYVRSLIFPFLAGGATLLVYALAEGNLGTAYRHRGEFVWALAVMAAAGLRSMADWRQHGTLPLRTKGAVAKTSD